MELWTQLTLIRSARLARNRDRSAAPWRDVQQASEQWQGKAKKRRQQNAEGALKEQRQVGVQQRRRKRGGRPRRRTQRPTHVVLQQAQRAARRRAAGSGPNGAAPAVAPLQQEVAQRWGVRQALQRAVQVAAVAQVAQAGAHGLVL